MTTVDLERLLKLRLVVARIGEMDLAQWWNTRGQLGRLGESALHRGFPRTHYFAQARSVFAVAAHRCSERYDRSGSVTLWKLPEEDEDAFDSMWEDWLDQAEEWRPFFVQLQQLKHPDLAVAIRAFGLSDAEDERALASLHRSAENRAVELPEPYIGKDRDLTLLGIAFAKGEIGSLAVPFAPAGKT